MSRKEGESGQASIEDCEDASYNDSRTTLERKSKETLITAARKNIRNIRTKRKTTKTRKRKWEEKDQYGYFKKQTAEIVNEMTWTWLRKGVLKREKNPLKTCYIKVKIDNTQQNSKRRLNEKKIKRLMK